MSKLDIDNALSYLNTRGQQAAFLRAKCRWAEVEDEQGLVANWIVAIHPDEVKAYVWARGGEDRYPHVSIAAYNIDHLLTQGNTNTSVKTALSQLGFKKEATDG